MSAYPPVTCNSYTLNGGHTDFNTPCCPSLDNDSTNSSKIAIFVALCVLNLNMSLFAWQTSRVVRSIRFQTETLHGLLPSCSSKECDLETTEPTDDTCGKHPGSSRGSTVSTQRAWQSGRGRFARWCSWMIGPAAAILVWMGILTQVDDGGSFAITHETDVSLPVYAATTGQRNNGEATRD
ncbi:hypothetical protein C8Q80DRAFT_1266120 [Daedaleopsis nitida]|nr:hypothetical protein C8Q80DRAFT_1266120 [Daedaleopsis nitida]